MVQILPRFDPGGEIGRSVGSGVGQGVEQATNRNLLKSGIESAKDQLATARDNKESINPLDFILDMTGKLSNVPGGLQALSELAPHMLKEVNRQNLMLGDENQPSGRPGGKPDGQPRTLPGGEPGGDPGIKPTNMYNGASNEPEEDELIPPEEIYDEIYKKNLRRTQDPEIAAKLTGDQLNARTAEQQARQQQQVASENFLKTKLESTFTEPLSSPLENKLSEDYFKAIKTSNPNKAFNNLMPKYRAAQVDEFKLNNSNAQTRPGLYLGDLKSRMDAARGGMQKLIDVDPEYAMQLAQDKLQYGAGEAAEIVRPGDKEYKQFVNQIPTGPDVDNIGYARGNLGLVDQESFDKDQKKYVDNTRRKVKTFLQKKFNPQKDSLLALRANMFDKNFPEAEYLNVVQEVFPEGVNTGSFSDFNRNEYPKLFEPIVPGLMDIFNSVIDLDFGRASKGISQRINKGRKKK